MLLLDLFENLHLFRLQQVSPGQQGEAVRGGGHRLPPPPTRLTQVGSQGCNFFAIHPVKKCAGYRISGQILKIVFLKGHFSFD